jgi:hypothetical protein
MQLFMIRQILMQVWSYRAVLNGGVALHKFSQASGVLTAYITSQLIKVRLLIIS